MQAWPARARAPKTSRWFFCGLRAWSWISSPTSSKTRRSAILVIILRSVHPDIMVGDDDHIEAALQRRLGDLGMAAMTIRIGGMHMKIYDDLVHWLTQLANGRYNPPA